MQCYYASPAIIQAVLGIIQDSTTKISVIILRNLGIGLNLQVQGWKMGTDMNTRLRFFKICFKEPWKIGREFPQRLSCVQSPHWGYGQVGYRFINTTERFH